MLLGCCYLAIKGTEKKQCLLGLALKKNPIDSQTPGRLISSICVYDIHSMCTFLFVVTHRFNIHLLSICYIAGIVLGSEDTAVYKTSKSLPRTSYVCNVHSRNIY